MIDITLVTPASLSYIGNARVTTIPLPGDYLEFNGMLYYVHGRIIQASKNAFYVPTVKVKVSKA